MSAQKGLKEAKINWSDGGNRFPVTNPDDGWRFPEANPDGGNRFPERNPGRDNRELCNDQGRGFDTMVTTEDKQTFVFKNDKYWRLTKDSIAHCSRISKIHLQ